MLKRINLHLDVILCFLLVIICYGYFFGAIGNDFNVNSRLALVKAILTEHRFEIDTFDRDGFFTLDEAFYNDHYYSDKAPGSSFTGVVLYLPVALVLKIFPITLSIPAFKQLLTLIAISIPSALLAPTIYLTARDITNNPFYALLIAASICVGTPLFVYGTTYYGHTIVGMYGFLVFFLWFRILSTDVINKLPTVFLSGFVLGLMIITELPTVLIAFPLLFYIAYMLWKQKKLFNWKVLLSLGLGLALPLASMFYYNLIIYGNPFSLSYAHEATKEFRDIIAAGFMGIGWPNLKVIYYATFHPTMGLFWQSPFLILAFPGWIYMLKQARFRIEAVLSFVIIAIFFIVLSGYSAWWGGLTFTPRYLIPILPFFGVPLIFIPDKWRPAFLVLGCIGIFQMMIVTASASDGLRELQNVIHLVTPAGAVSLQPDAFLHSTIYDVYLPNFLKGKMIPNVTSYLMHRTGPGTVLPLLMIAGLLIAMFFITKKNTMDN